MNEDNANEPQPDDEEDTPSATPGELRYVKWERLSLKDHPHLDEQWLEDRLVKDPGLLGLGEGLELVDRQRRQSTGGRLDLLFADRSLEDETRYTVEIQLGRTDPDHIIRTLEYWDIESRYDPHKRKHVAVLVAEEITSRFFNVIGLFNRHIDIIAIQVSARMCGDEVMLFFTRVLDREVIPTIPEEQDIVTDSDYWTSKSEPDVLQSRDQVLELIRQFDPHVKPRYTKKYIGLSRNDRPHNYVRFRPQKGRLIVEVKRAHSEILDGELRNAGIEFSYDRTFGYYRLIVTVETLRDPSQREYLADFIRAARDEWGS